MAQGLNHVPIIKETNINKININIKREQKREHPREDPAGIFNFYFFTSSIISASIPSQIYSKGLYLTSDLS
jgi:hypothetical protein